MYCSTLKTIHLGAVLLYMCSLVLTTADNRKNFKSDKIIMEINMQIPTNYSQSKNKNVFSS